MDADAPPTPPRRITEPLPVRPPLPLPQEDEELIATRRELDACRARLSLLSAQVRLIQRMEAPRRGS